LGKFYPELLEKAWNDGNMIEYNDLMLALEKLDERLRISEFCICFN
jgi:hypothetical protein